jgi:hypothetical protein
MTPLFCELEELGKTQGAGAEDGEPESTTLDIDEFVDALGRLYE